MIVLECENSKVVLQGPDFNDTHTLNMNVTFKKAMNGQVRTYIKRATHNKSFVISGVNRPITEAITDFMQTYYGKELTITEYFEGLDPVKWFGKIVSPIETVHQAIRDNRTAISFEGVRYA